MIKKIKLTDEDAIMILHNGVGWDINFVGEDTITVECHVMGPDDIDEWRENAKSMLAFCEIVEAIQFEFPGHEFEITSENFGMENELAATIYLTSDQFNELYEKYK